MLLKIMSKSQKTVKKSIDEEEEEEGGPEVNEGKPQIID